jgi:hypothetical protein
MQDWFWNAGSGYCVVEIGGRLLEEGEEKGDGAELFRLSG